MDLRRDDRARIGAYLLGKLPQGDRDELEALILEQPSFLAVVRETEALILSGSFLSRQLMRRYGALWFAAGAVSGAVLTWFAVSVVL